MTAKKTTPSWTDVKTKLVEFNRAGLISLLQDLYTASKDNQVFLHSRFVLGGDVLKPYKVTINRWLWPDVFKKQAYSVAKAKKAISDYKKAVGQLEGLAELMVFYCERAAGFSVEVGLQDDGYFDALVRMFEQALKTIATLPNGQQPDLWKRLDEVRRICQHFANDIAYDMSALQSEYGVDD